MYKRLRNLRKLNARKKKRCEEDKEKSDEEQEFTVRARAKRFEEIFVDSDSKFEDNW